MLASTVASFDDVDLAAIAVDDLPAVAPGGAPADALGFEHDDGEAAFGQREPCRDTGITGPHDADVGVDGALEAWAGLGRIRGRRVIGADVAALPHAVRRF
jgi:hypothetical protein